MMWRPMLHKNGTATTTTSSGAGKEKKIKENIINTINHS